MLLALAACGGDAEVAEAEKEYVYIANYPTVEDKLQTGYSMNMENGMIYTSFNEAVEGTEQYDTVIAKIEHSGDTLSIGEQITLQAPSGCTIQSYSFDKEGNIHAIGVVYPQQDNVADWDAYQRSVKYSHFIFDANGNQIAEKDFSATIQQMENSWVDRLLTDDAGNSVAISGDMMLFFNPQGDFIGTEKLSGWTNSNCKGSDGKLYISYYSESAGGNAIGVVDFGTRKVIDTKLTGYVRNMAAGVNEKLLLLTDDTFYLADAATGEKESLCRAVDCDVVPDQISDCIMLEDESILIRTNDWSLGTTDFVLLKKSKPAEIVEKTKITVASLYADSSINNYIVQFNKQSDTTKIVVKNYISNDVNWTETTYTDALTNLKNDLISGNSDIDILYLNAANELYLAGKEAQLFVDLKEYVAGSKKISLDDYFDTVLQSASVGDTLVMLPRSFYLQSLVCKSKFLNGKTSWTMEDLAAITKQYPESSLFGKAHNKQSVLLNLMTLYDNAFVNTVSGTCDFTSQGFKNMLELSAAYPDDYDYDDSESTAEALAADKMLLYSAYVSNWQDMQLAQAYFGQDDITFIGYPTPNGASGTVMQTGAGFAILQKSKEIKKAWEFVEFVASAPYDRWSDYAFPARRGDYKALEAEYLIPQDGSSMMSDGTWTYEYHTTTKDEAELTDYLVEHSIPARYTISQDMLQIILEEAQPYFQGVKALDDVCQVIQSRIDIFLKENM